MSTSQEVTKAVSDMDLNGGRSEPDMSGSILCVRSAFLKVVTLKWMKCITFFRLLMVEHTMKVT